MTANHITALLELARKWGDEGKDELAHHALDVIGREAEQEATLPPCPNCGEAYADETVTANLLRQAEKMAREGIKVETREYNEMD